MAIDDEMARHFTSSRLLAMIEGRQGPRRAPGNAALIAAAALAFVLFAANVADHLVARTLCCADDVFISVAAKNLATGRGYASSYNPAPDGSNELRRYDPMITTGPGLVVPAAAAIRVFGNRYWVPGAVVVSLNLLLLGWIGWHLAAATRAPARWAPAAVAGIAALNLLTVGNYEHWYALLGEVPTLLLLCLAVLRCFSGGGHWHHFAGGGLLLGWASQVKALALIAVAVVLPAIALFAALGAADCADRRPGGLGRLRRGLFAAAVAAAFACVPTLIVETVKLADLGWEGLLRAKAAESRLMETSRESGLQALRRGRSVENVRAIAAHNWQNLTSYFRSGWAAAAFFVALALVFGARSRWRNRDTPVPLVLVAMAAVYAAWWLLLSEGGRIRYLLIGLGLWCFGVVFDLFLGPWSLRKLALALAFSAAVLPKAEHLAWIAPPRPLFQPSPRTAAMLEASRYLEDHRDGGVIAADWWATGAEMEYLLSGSGNLVHHASLERLDAPRLLFFENAKWIDLPKGGRYRWQRALARHEASSVFERDRYRIYVVPPSDLEAPEVSR
jgi:hypothetical protein